MKYVLIVAAVTAIATPALAEEIGVGVGVGPVGGGVTVGEGHRDYDRDRDRDRTTVIKEREPADHTTVIKKENEDGTRAKQLSKTGSEKEGPHYLGLSLTAEKHNSASRGFPAADRPSVLLLLVGRVRAAGSGFKASVAGVVRSGSRDRERGGSTGRR